MLFPRLLAGTKHCGSSLSPTTRPTCKQRVGFFPSRCLAFFCLCLSFSLGLSSLSCVFHVIRMWPNFFLNLYFYHRLIYLHISFYLLHAYLSSSLFPFFSFLLFSFLFSLFSYPFRQHRHQMVPEIGVGSRSLGLHHESAQSSRQRSCVWDSRSGDVAVPPSRCMGCCVSA